MDEMGELLGQVIERLKRQAQIDEYALRWLALRLCHGGNKDMVELVERARAVGETQLIKDTADRKIDA